MPQKNKGFTILELSIVVTIISLLVGTVVMGITMKRNAELQGVMADQDVYIKAIQAFQDKYHYLPGDMPNAESFWGSDPTCPNAPATATPHMATCNGDGNGHVADFSLNGNTNYEIIRVWQHLANAGFIKGSYTGVFGSAPSYVILGVNTPITKIKGAGFSMYYTPPGYSDANNWASKGNHKMDLGSILPNQLTPNGPLLTPAEALSIDQKMDDGLPSTGSVLTFTTNYQPNCTTGSNPNYVYNTAYTSVACNLNFLIGF